MNTQNCFSTNKMLKFKMYIMCGINESNKSFLSKKNYWRNNLHLQKDKYLLLKIWLAPFNWGTKKDSMCLQWLPSVYYKAEKLQTNLLVKRFVINKKGFLLRTWWSKCDKRKGCIYSVIKECYYTHLGLCRSVSVVYFDQRLSAAHSKRWFVFYCLLHPIFFELSPFNNFKGGWFIVIIIQSHFASQ